MTAENHSPPARSLRRTQCTNLWVVYNCALSKLRGFRLLPFQQFFQYILRVLPVKNEFQQQHYIIVRQAFRLLQKTFQHTATGTEPMGSFTPGQLLQLVLQCLFIIHGFPQLLFAFLQLPVEFFQL